MNGYPVQEQEGSLGGQKTPKRRRGLVWAIVIVAAIALLLCVATGVVLGLPYLTGEKVPPDLPVEIALPGMTGDEMLLAFPSRHGDVELYLLEVGQDEDEGTLLAEDAKKALATFWLVEEKKYRSRIGGTYGGFVPGSDRLLVWYVPEDEIVIQQMRARDEEPAEVLESKASTLGGIVFGAPDFVFLEEPREEGERCYVAGATGEAERVAKGDDCEVSWDGSVVYVSETSGDGTTISAVDINGENETVLVDEVEGVTSYRISEDGSHVAYVQVDGDESRLYLVERSSGEETGDERT